jgi:predicted XRE-type DNA-binding protein
MEAKGMEIQTFDNVFDALADTHAEAANLKARSELLSALKARVRSWNLAQEVAASRLGITRARLNDLLQGKVANSRSMHWSTSAWPLAWLFKSRSPKRPDGPNQHIGVMVGDRREPSAVLG